MKSQNLIAVAMTTALALTAAALFVARTPPDISGGDTAATGSESELPSTSRLNNADSQVIPEPQVAASAAATAPRHAHVPLKNRRIGCQNGLSAEFDNDGKPQGYTCNSTPYEEYSNDALASLAYGDAEAASVLAYRLRRSDYPQAIQMARRSAALSGGDVSTLISATYWRPMEDQSGKLDISGVGQAYVLHSLIQKIRGNEIGMPPTYEKMIRELSDDAEADLNMLDNIAQRMFEEVRQIELDVTGTSTIGGDDDV